jgi:hypothetical protein
MRGNSKPGAAPNGTVTPKHRQHYVYGTLWQAAGANVNGQVILIESMVRHVTRD